MTQIFTKGVEELINKIQEEGVQQAQVRADKLIDDAHKQASIIIDRALQEAEQTIEDAKKQAKSELNSGKDALNLAVRDMLLDFRAIVTKEFQEQLGRMVTNALENEKTIEKLILLIAKNTLDTLGDYDNENLKLLLKQPPQKFMKQSKKFEKANQEVNELVSGISYEVIAKGIKFTGLKVIMKNKKITVDFTDEALKAALASYLQPRFAALISGLNT